MNAFGTSFIVINSVYQPLKEPFTRPNKKDYYWHIATIARGFKEYCAYCNRKSNEIWIEEVDSTNPAVFKKITDDKEWCDIRDFLIEAKLLEIGSRTEIAVGQLGITGKGI